MKSAAKKIAIPRIAVPTARRATAIVSRWLRSEVSPLLLAGRATYNPVRKGFRVKADFSYAQSYEDLPSGKGC